VRLRAVLLISVALLAAGCAAGALGKRVDIGDFRLRAHTTGQGSPTVVFDGGLGERLETWNWVWPEIAKSTRIFIYDRAGLGLSEPGPLPRTSERIVRELRALLKQSAIEPPYILVGHSSGALNMRLFAGLHPEEVLGLVLVDPTPVDFPALDREMQTEEVRIRRETHLALARPANRHEFEAVEQSADQVRDQTLSPSLPVIVVSSTRPEESVEFRRSWMGMQVDLAERLSATRHIVSEESGHYIQFDQPELVIEAIHEMIDLVGGARIGQEPSAPR
jgi:pimeloyl-ACP methyl ester carboxylesterase